MNYTINTRDVGGDGLTLDVRPNTNSLVNNAIIRILTDLWIKGRIETTDLDTYRTVRVIFESPQTEDTVVKLIEALTKGDITKDITIEEAGKRLQEDLDRYCGASSYAMVGLDDVGNQLFLYTETRKQGNRLAAFVGWTFHGYKIVVKVFGKVRILGRSRA
jgi:hypothetical protein